jgi:hypothetical protein
MHQCSDTIFCIRHLVSNRLFQRKTYIKHNIWEKTIKWSSMCRFGSVTFIMFSYFHISTSAWSYYHFHSIFSIFPATVMSSFLQKKSNLLFVWYFVVVEMLDKLITHIVSWYNTLRSCLLCEPVSLWYELYYILHTCEENKTKNGESRGSWSYGSCIYNYPCNQCILPLTLWLRTPLRKDALGTTLRDKVCQWLAHDPRLSPFFVLFSSHVCKM